MIRGSLSSLLLVASLSVAFAGCSKFGRLTNRCLDKVDRHNDRSVVYLDHLYTPRTDLTRVGEPDWCQVVKPRVAARYCQHREGAQDVPLPSFVVYPQPMGFGADAISSGGYGNPGDYDASSDTLVPPQPGRE